MFHEMRYVLAVYRERSFSRAAQKLFISQPSLSAMVKRAETKIGGRIFDRSVSPIGLTSIGREYIRAAEQLAEIEENFKQYISDEAHCLTGAIAIGGTTLFTSYILPPLLSEFSARHPGVEIRVHETHTVTLLRELSEGDLDLIADNGDFDSALYARQPFQSERLLLMVPAERPVNSALEPYRLTAGDITANRHLSDRQPAVSPDVFRDEPFLLLKEGNDTRARADRLCALAGFRPQIRLLLDQQITAYNLACYGMGATFISDTLVRHLPPMNRVFFYKLEGETAQREICFFSKRSRSLPNAVLAFMQMVREQADR